MKIKDLKSPYKEMALANQVKQGNEENEHKNLTAAATFGGFWWDNAIEDNLWWEDVDRGESPEITDEIKANYPEIFKNEKTDKMKIEIGKKYRLNTWDDGEFLIVLIIKGTKLCGEDERGMLYCYDIDRNWLPYTEPAPVKVWKTFLIEHIEYNGDHSQMIYRFKNLEAARERHLNAFSITEIKLNYTEL
jgi:hypothetical protein